MYAKKLIELGIAIGKVQAVRIIQDNKLQVLRQDEIGLKTSIIPEGGWPGSNEGARNAARDAAYLNNPDLISAAAEIRGLELEIAQTRADLVLLEEERRAYEWSVRDRMADGMLNEGEEVEAAMDQVTDRPLRALSQVPGDALPPRVPETAVAHVVQNERVEVTSKAGTGPSGGGGHLPAAPSVKADTRDTVAGMSGNVGQMSGSLPTGRVPSPTPDVSTAKPAAAAQVPVPMTNEQMDLLLAAATAQMDATKPPEITSEASIPSSHVSSAPVSQAMPRPGAQPVNMPGVVVAPQPTVDLESKAGKKEELSDEERWLKELGF